MPTVQHIPKVNAFVSWLVVTCVITPNWAGACQNTREQKSVVLDGGGVRKYTVGRKKGTFELFVAR